MSKIKLTLTAEHYKLIAVQYDEWFEDECNSYEESGSLHPLTLEFDVPNPTLLEQVADKLKDKELFPESVAKGREIMKLGTEIRLKAHTQTTETVCAPGLGLIAVTGQVIIYDPWRTDIENAPRDGTTILIWSYDEIYVAVPLDCSEYKWENEYDVFKNSEISYWMEIPKLPEL